MVRAIDIVMETYVGGEWKLVFGDDEAVIESYQREIDRIKNNEERRLIAEFSGELEKWEWRKQMNKDVVPLWIDSIINHHMCAVLSDINNDGRVIPYKQGSRELLTEIEMSETTTILFKDASYNYHTVLGADEISSLKDTIYKNAANGVFNEVEVDNMLQYIKINFEESLEKQKHRFNDLANVRFIITYQE